MKKTFYVLVAMFAIVMMITMRTRLVRQKEQSDLFLMQEMEYKKL